MNILKDEEVPLLVNYVDTDQKGYVNFREFS